MTVEERFAAARGQADIRGGRIANAGRVAEAFWRLRTRRKPTP